MLTRIVEAIGGLALLYGFVCLCLALRAQRRFRALGNVYERRR